MIWQLEIVPWSMHETYATRNGDDRHMCRPLYPMEYGSMVHNQTRTEIVKFIHVPTPSVLLDNGSMVYDQTNVDRNGKYH